LAHSECTGQIIGAFYEVYNGLGPGLAERVYSRALSQELGRRGCRVQPEHQFELRYGNARLARFRADMIVDGKVVVEVKARSRLLRGHWAQLLNYMRASAVEVGLLLNFGPRPQFKRFVLSQCNPRIQANTKDRPSKVGSQH
jgi:GxxExxY protein